MTQSIHNHLDAVQDYQQVGDALEDSISNPDKIEYDPRNPLNMDLSQVGPVAMIWRMMRIKFWQPPLYMLLFLSKNAPQYLMTVSVAMCVEILTNPGKYPKWSLPAVGAVLLVSLSWNIPGHVWYITLISKHLRNMEHTLRGALVRRLQRLSIRFHSDSDTGAMQTRVVRDVENVEMMMKQITEAMVQAFFTLTFAIVLTLYHKPVIALFYLVATPLCVGLMWCFRRVLRTRNQEFRSDVEAVGGRMNEMINMIPVTRAHGVEHIEIKKAQGYLDHLRNSGLRLDKTNGLFQSSTWVTLQFSVLVSLMCMSAMVYYDQMSIAAMVLYMGLFMQIITGVMVLLNIVPVIHKGGASLGSLREILRENDLEHHAGKPQVKDVHGDIVFENVAFSYPDREQLAISNMNLHVFPGECIAFVGESGSGKSTTMSLLIGFFHPTKGRIRIDGHDMTQLNLRTWRQQIAVVPQQTILFAGSLRDNITYGLENISENRVQEVIDAANLRDVVNNMPEGLNTLVGENGVRLSGGQRQRIAIARALIRDPKVIILDEATSALDVISEKQVQEAINRLIKGRTTFIVAHRLSTIRQADRIVVMRDGEVVEHGTHDALIQEDGEFARLKALQH